MKQDLPNNTTPLVLLVKKLYQCLVLMNVLLGVVPHFSSLVTMEVPVPLWDVASDCQSSEGEPSVDYNSRFSFLHLTCRPCARLDRNGTTRSCMVPFQLYGSSFWREVKVRKGNLSLFPNGQVYAVIFVNDSAVVNHKDGQWTMTGSLKTIVVKPLALPWHSNHTYIRFGHFTRSRDDLCLIVSGVRKKNTHSLLVQVLHLSHMSAQTIYLLL